MNHIGSCWAQNNNRLARDAFVKSCLGAGGGYTTARVGGETERNKMVKPYNVFKVKVMGWLNW